jgi:hypothetical protein
VPVTPFTIRYTLTRRQRLGELLPWLPALAGSVGFSVGAAYLAAVVTPWCLILLLLPLVMYRGLVALALELVFRPHKPVELTVDAGELVARVGDESRRLPLEGIIQVFRTEGTADWTVLHLDGSAFTIPAGSIAPEQLDYLKAFALRAARQRRAARDTG